MRTIGAAQPMPFAAEVPAVAEQLPLLRDGLAAWLRENDCPAERAERVLLAANEAVTNAIEHAYRTVPPGPVRLSAESLSDGSVRITVADRGRWQPAIPTDGIRGRGVLMMQECGDEVRIERSGSGTTVVVLTSATRYPEPIVGVAAELVPFTVECHPQHEHVVARLSGAVPAAAAHELRRRLLAATYGGVNPLTIDVGAVAGEFDGLESAIVGVAGAAAGVGGRVSVVVPRHSPVASAIAWHQLGSAVEVREPR